MRYSELYNFVMPKLEKELSPIYTYHDANHTKEVMVYAELIAMAEGIENEDLIIVKTAALMHDIGFLQGYGEHEAVSCEMSKEILVDYDYTQAQIEQVCKMILATQLPQSAQDHFSEILCDADLYYLGTDKYKLNSAKLYQEFKNTNPNFNPTDWQSIQYNFLTNQKYYTQTARDACSENVSNVIKGLSPENSQGEKKRIVKPKA